ncbi:hypothetical protein SAMN04487950_4107 [Halogranum rubrum]|uniref:Uncharacterized protein n=1 Tax=Halogranum rubrum TaxID=553466 RepID=A0A1I4IGD4_9EURY|nr:MULTISPECIES: hypothetical protein [Halogranum]SFL53344.1 hypothetical protein SAMN04487950_4107 [Halogranum rubrum]
MYESPSPTHGYIPVVLAFWLYVGLAAGVSLVAREVGVSNEISIYLFLLVAIVLLKPFLPLFQQLLPKAPHER